MALIGISGRIGSGKDTVGVIIQYLICLKLNTLAPHQFRFEDFTKSSASNEIQSGFRIKKFADVLKDMVCILIGCTREQLENAEFKNTELGKEWTIWYMTHYKLNGQKIGKIYASLRELKQYEDSDFFQKLSLEGYEVVSKRLTPILLLQLLETECGREIIHPNIWVNTLFSKYKPVGINHVGIPHTTAYLIGSKIYPNWIITDMRFPNELEAVKSKEGITIRVVRETGTIDSATKLESFLMHDIAGVPEHASETALDNAEFDEFIDNSAGIPELIEKVREILIRRKII